MFRNKDVSLFRLTLLAGLTSLLTCVGFVARGIFARPTLGKLVAVPSTIVWKSPSVRDGIQSMRAEVEFRLINQGRTTVHITSVESACGCTTPTVRPTEVQPGGTYLLSAVGTPLSSGERTVPITIHTDSSLSPEVIVKLTMISDRLAPFITGVSGDFAYLEGYSTAESRDFVVTTIESGPHDKTPLVQTDLPFLSVSGPSVEERPYDESTLVQRSYTYQIKFDRELPRDSFTGRIWAVDPWSGAKSEGVLAFHRAKEELVVIPTTVILDVDSDTKAGQTEIAVLTNTEMPGLIVEPHGDDKILKVLEITPAGGGRFRKFRIRAEPGNLAGIKTLSLRARRNPDDVTPVVIPVILRSRRDD
jgi:hypothetical protein